MAPGPRPCPCGQGCAGGSGLCVPHPKDSRRGVHVDPGPQRDWSPPPRAWGRGCYNWVPLFCSSEPGEVIAQGGAGRTQVSVSPAPQLVGRGRGGRPVCRSVRRIWRLLRPASRRGGADPHPSGQGRAGAIQNCGTLLPPSRSRGCGARPLGSQGRPGPNLAPSAPISPVGRW